MEEVPKVPKTGFTGDNAATVKHIGSIGIGNTKVTQRLQLEGGHASLKIATLAKEQVKGLKSFLFVQIKDTDTFINIRSAAKRLGLTHGEVKELAKQGRAFIDNAMVKRDQALKEYEKIVNNYSLRWGKLKKDQTTTSLKPETLLHTIQKGLKILNFKEGDAFEIFTTEKLNQLHVFTKKLGEGAFGVVYKTFDLKHPTIPLATKQIDTSPEDIEIINKKNISTEEKTKLIQMPQVNAENEQKILKKLKGHKAFLPPPSDIAVLTNSKGDKKTVHQFQLMAGDLRKGSDHMNKFYQLPIKQQFQLFKTPLEGSVYMHSKGITHQDFKPDNFLMEIDSEGNPKRIVIIDLGSAKEGKNEENVEPGEVGMSSFYVPYDFNGHTRKEVDTYAFALNLIVIFSQKNEQELDPDSYQSNQAPVIHPNTNEYNQIQEWLTNNQVPQGMANLLLQQVGPKGGRLSEEAFLQKYDEELNKLI